MGRDVGKKFFLFPLLILVLLKGTGRAEVLSGIVELIDQRGKSRVESSASPTLESKSKFFLQRYTLNFHNAVLPQVFLRAGMRVEKQDFSTETDGITSKTKTTVLLPSIGLTLSNPFVHAGVGYDERHEKVESGGRSQTTIRKTTNAFLGFRPEGLPTLDLRYVGQKRHDKERIVIDQESTLFSLNSTYRPVRTVQLYYTATHEDSEQHLTGSETKSLAQSARVSYGDRFFDDRVALSANYSITRQDVRSTRGSVGGAVRVQLFPIAGLSGINDLPAIGVLVANSALIDGNLAASSGINIGQSPSLGGDTRKRNTGLDFGLPTDVSALFVWVDRPLPSAVANAYIWEIYTSQDNQNWSLYQTVSPAAFDLFDNRFEITFPSVRTRYIMAVTRPLSVAIIAPPGVDVNNIFITELQAFLDQPVSQSAGSTTDTVLKSNSVDVNTRAHIIRSDRHSLLYDLFYLERTAEQTGREASRTSTLTNALIANERFSRVLTGSAKVMRRDDEFTGGESLTTYEYQASLMAAMTSLPKLSHNAVLAAKREEFVELDTRRDTGSFSLTNTAEIYPGINAYLGGIESLVTTVTNTSESRTEGTIVTVGAEIIPHRTMTITTNYDWAETEQRGSGVFVIAGPDITRRQSTTASVAYTPFSSLYLFGSIQRIEQTGQPSITLGFFSGSWSAQRTGGNLEFRFSYGENYETQTRTRSRGYGPGIRWKINPKTFLDVAYTITTIDTPLDKTDSSSLNTSFKMYL